MKTDSHHFLIELKEVSFDVLNNVQLVENLLLESILNGGGTSLGSKFHKFDPHGLSGVILLSESHVSIHTWPEWGYAALDVFTCGDKTVGDKICQYIFDSFNSTNYNTTYIKRGI